MNWPILLAAYAYLVAGSYFAITRTNRGPDLYAELAKGAILVLGWPLNPITGLFKGVVRWISSLES